MEELGLDVERDSIYREMALAAIQLGRRDDAIHSLERAETLARAGHRRIDLHNVLLARTAMAIAEGRFMEAKSAAAQLQNIGGRHNVSIALAYSAQVAAIRAEEGRVNKVITDLGSVALEASPMTIAWRTMLAGLLADAGQLDEASTHFESLAADHFSIIPRDWAFPLAVRYLAEVCAQLGDTERAAELVPEVRAYSGQLLVVTLGTSIEGAADRSLGQLLGVLGSADEAERHYKAAAKLENSLGFAPLAARTQYWHARLLASSADAGNRRRAANLLRTAESVSGRYGMVLLGQQARALLDAINSHHRS
jgi:tetratricopeptide (TPR) repeat protein